MGILDALPPVLLRNPIANLPGAILDIPTLGQANAPGRRAVRGADAEVDHGVAGQAGVDPEVGVL